MPRRLWGFWMEDGIGDSWLFGLRLPDAIMRIERPHVLVRTIGKEDVIQAKLEQIRRLERLYAEGYEDSFLDRSLRKIIAHQVARDQADLAGLEKGLAELAARYNMDFEEFYTRYREGQLGMM